MIYSMSERAYREYTTSKKGYKGLSHGELVDHINKEFGIRGKITDIKID